MKETIFTAEVKVTAISSGMRPTRMATCKFHHVGADGEQGRLVRLISPHYTLTGGKTK